MALYAGSSQREGCGIVEMNLGLGWPYSLWVGVGFWFGCLPTHLAPNIAVCRPLGALLLVALDLLEGMLPLWLSLLMGPLMLKVCAGGI